MSNEKTKQEEISKSVLKSKNETLQEHLHAVDFEDAGGAECLARNKIRYCSKKKQKNGLRGRCPWMTIPSLAEYLHHTVHEERHV